MKQFAANYILPSHQAAKGVNPVVLKQFRSRIVVTSPVFVTGDEVMYGFVTIAANADRAAQPLTSEQWCLFVASVHTNSIFRMTAPDHAKSPLHSAEPILEQKKSGPTNPDNLRVLSRILQSLPYPRALDLPQAVGEV